MPPAMPQALDCAALGPLVDLPVALQHGTQPTPSAALQHGLHAWWVETEALASSGFRVQVVNPRSLGPALSTLNQPKQRGKQSLTLYPTHLGPTPAAPICGAAVSARPRAGGMGWRFDPSRQNRWSHSRDWGKRHLLASRALNAGTLSMPTRQLSTRLAVSPVPLHCTAPALPHSLLHGRACCWRVLPAQAEPQEPQNQGPPLCCLWRQWPWPLQRRRQPPRGPRASWQATSPPGAAGTAGSTAHSPHFQADPSVHPIKAGRHLLQQEHVWCAIWQPVHQGRWPLPGFVQAQHSPSPAARGCDEAGSTLSRL